MPPIPAGGEGVGGAIFFRKIEGMGWSKGLGREGNGVGYYQPSVGLYRGRGNSVEHILQSIFQNGTSSKSD